MKPKLRLSSASLSNHNYIKMFYLNKIEIQNFGLHKQFTHEFNGHLTGIIGLNGSGKSTLRQAIEWGLRGTITHKDPITDFVHSADGVKHYPMQVVLHFTADGRKGSITRRVTASAATRSLTLEGMEGGKPVTSEKQVAEVMEQILGVDKQALGGSVFLEQGSLRAMFGDASDRRNLYMRILGLTEVTKVSNVIGVQLKKVSDSVTDYTIQEQGIALSLTDNRHACRLLETELAAQTDYTDLCGLLDRKISHASRVSQLQERVRDLQATAGDLASVPTLRHTREESVAQRQAIQVKRSESLARQNDVLRLEAEIRFSQQQEVLAEEIRVMTTERDASAFSPEELTNASESVVDLQNIVNSYKRVAELKLVVDEQTKILEQITVGDLDSKHETAKATLATANSELQEAVKMLELSDALLGLKHGCQDNACSLCGSTNPDYSYVAEAAENLRRKCDVLRSKVASARMDEVAAEVELVNVTTQRTKASGLLANATTSIEHLKPLLSSDQTATVEEFESKLVNARARSAELAERGHRATYLDRQITAKVGSLDHKALTPTDRQMVEMRVTALRSLLLSDEQLSELGIEELNLTARIQELSNRITGIEAAAGQLSNLEAEKTQAEAQHAETWLQLHAVPVFTAWKKEIDATTIDGLLVAHFADECFYDLASQHFSEITSNYAAKKGLLEARREICVQLEKDLAEVKKQIASQAVRRQVIEDLTLLRDAFRPTGLIQSYMDMRFKAVAKRAAEILAASGSDFVVAASNIEPLAFTFCRTNKDGGWLHHNRMSGGQQVKLAVAVLQALHSLLLPGVGFMILDEPSTHLDEVAAASLAEMLQGVGRSGNMQLLVCDHHPLLISVFEDRIDLR